MTWHYYKIISHTHDPSKQTPWHQLDHFKGFMFRKISCQFSPTHTHTLLDVIVCFELWSSSSYRTLCRVGQLRWGNRCTAGFKLCLHLKCWGNVWPLKHFMELVLFWGDSFSPLSDHIALLSFTNTKTIWKKSFVNMNWILVSFFRTIMDA